MDPNEFPLRKFVAPEFIFGMNARNLAGRYAKNFGGRKVLVVTDPGVRAAGWCSQVVASLDESGIDHVLFDEVTSNPKAEEVAAGAALYRREGCNAIVAVGGGSPMDCAKGIGIVSTNHGDIVDFEGVDRVEQSIPPLICIPTTAGSAADVSQFAIITDSVRLTKIAIISKMIVPDVALIDPVTTTSLSRDLTAQTALDALCHGIESYVSTAHSAITDLYAIQAVRAISSNLLPTLSDPGNLAFRGRLMLASLEAGLAFSNASLGLVHAMAHSLGGMNDAPHGECNALLLPHVIDFNFPAVPERYARIAEAIGVATGDMAPDDILAALHSRLSCLLHAAGILRPLGNLGISRSEIPKLAEKAIEDPCIFTNPRQPSREEIEAIYERAF